MSLGHPPPGAASPVPEARLLGLLARTKRALQRAALVEGSIVLLTGILLAIAIGAVLVWQQAEPSTVALVELFIIFAAFCFVAIRYGHLFATAFGRPKSIALWLDRAIEESPGSKADRVALLSAIELAADRDRAGESELLREAAIEAATDGVADLDALGLVRHQARRSIERRLVPLGASLAAIALFAVLGPRHVLHALSALVAAGTIDNALSPLTGEPRLDDIKLTFRYPAYTERLSRTVTSPSGEIRALPGTEVQIETRARDDLAQATLLVAHGEPGEEGGEPAKVQAEVDGRRIKATLVVQRAGRYRFRLRTQKGDTLEERRGHEIDLELDEPPEITLIEPEETPLEVNERDRPNLVFDTKDDFGLGDVVVAWRVIGGTREGKEPLTTGSRGLKRYPGSAQLDLQNLQLKPGDRVAYTLEVRDNDTVNGPKIGASATKELRVYSKSAHHEQVLTLQEQAVDELVHILGDNLDSSLEVKAELEPYKKLLDAGDTIVERALSADQLLKKTVAAVRKDPLGRKAVAEAFEAARTQLYADARKLRAAVGAAKKMLASLKKPDKASGFGALKTQDGMVSSLEKNVVYLADLLNDQRMIDAEGLVKELRAQQQALKKALEEYKNAPDPEKRKMLAQSIKEIKQRISEIMQQLSKLKGSIPTDFVNQDALETKDSQEGMDAVQRMIEEGDLEGAMAELDRMLAQTESMMAQLNNGREELGSREYGEIQEQAEKLWKDLETVEKEQRELARQTEKISKEVLERMKSRLGDSNSFVDKQKKRLQQAQQGLERAKPGSHAMEGDMHDQATRRLEDGIKALEARDFGAAREMVENAADSILQLEQDAHRRADQAHRFGDLFNGGKTAEKAEKELRKIRPILDEVLKDIEKLMPPPDSLLSKEERDKLDRQAERQAELKEQAGKLGEQLDKLNQQIPIVGPGMKSMLEEAQGAMGQSGQSLGQGDAPSGLNQERRALDALNRLKQELAKKGQQGGGGGGGVPLPFGSDQGQDGGGHGPEGNDPTLDRVEIPKPEQFKAPTEFRQDIMEAAKQGTVEDYREAVRRYYEELVK
jgi:uncharacterized protein DUF4175